MDYKQHKGNLRGQIKNKVERKLYNKRIRSEDIDEEEISISIKRTWAEQVLIDDRLDGKCDSCKSRERYIEGRHEYCGGCGSITHFNKTE